MRKTALVIDISKYLNHVVEVDPKRKIARVEPGTILDDLREAAKADGLTYGRDPTPQPLTLGGMIGNNLCAVHTVMAEFYRSGPRTADKVEEIDVTYDGVRLRVGATSDEEPIRWFAPVGATAKSTASQGPTRALSAADPRSFPAIPRRGSGYNLPQLSPERALNLGRALMGTESTCAITVEATVKLIPNPRARVLLILDIRASMKPAIGCRRSGSSSRWPLIPRYRPKEPAGGTQCTGRMIPTGFWYVLCVCLLAIEIHSSYLKSEV